MSNILQDIKHLARRIEPVGSRVTCDPPPTDTDADYLVFVDSSKRDELVNLLVIHDESEFVPSDVPAEAGFERRSFRFGEINIILTSDVVFFNKFMASTELAKRFNLLDKQDRIDLFKAIRGEYPETIPEDYMPEDTF